jgi:hypothetical protein
MEPAHKGFEGLFRRGVEAPYSCGVAPFGPLFWADFCPTPASIITVRADRGQKDARPLLTLNGIEPMTSSMTWKIRRADYRRQRAYVQVQPPKRA